MERDDAPAMARRQGSRLTDELLAVDGVVDVRGMGLLIATELAAGLDARRVAAAALDAGLVVNGVTPSALRLAPPLTISDDEIDEGVALLAKVVADEAAS
jgi:acetylornithine/succinyldiaminopimelate/putrescine aminotransferase